jgi:hypothetical protein
LSTAARRLSAADAVELAHAWTQRFAERHRIRAVFIKGPTSAHHELRSHRVSADVDVLVDPAHFDRFCELLAETGWRPRPATFASSRYSLHSRTFIADDWPCDLDVHRTFPGFLEDPQRVFDLIWSRRHGMTLANVDCTIPDKASAILILALHARRSRDSDPRHQNELAEMITRVSLDDAEKADLANLAVRSGSAQTSGDVLAALGLVDERFTEDLESDSLRAWQVRVGSGASATSMWLALLRGARGTEFMRIMRHAVWPSDADLAVMYPHLQGGPVIRNRARLHRLGRGIAAFPRALAVSVAGRIGSARRRGTQR